MNTTQNTSDLYLKWEKSDKKSTADNNCTLGDDMGGVMQKGP